MEVRPFEDKDLIDYFEQGINDAIKAIKPSEFIVSMYKGQEFLDGLKMAGAASNGLAHTQHNPAWLMVRDQIETMANLFKQIIIARKMLPRRKLTELLATLLAKAKIMAAEKAVTRQDVLLALDRRKEKHVVN